MDINSIYTLTQHTYKTKLNQGKENRGLKAPTVYQEHSYTVPGGTMER
jgi:hypothetical protein